MLSSALKTLRQRWIEKLPPIPTTPPAHTPDRSTLLTIAAVMLCAILSHFFIASKLVAGFTLIIFALKTTFIYWRRPNLSQRVILLLSILSLGLVIVAYGGWNSQQAGISFLILLLALKFLESKTLRDYFVVCILLFFVAATSFLFANSPTTTILVIFYTIAITGLLTKLANPLPMPWMQNLRDSGMILVKALPIAILLFFLFPRIQGDFGFLPSQDKNGEFDQLSDSLNAGDFASSAFNNHMVFRVEFDGQIPSNHERYWRSKVMLVEQNFNWQLGEPSAYNKRQSDTTSELNVDLWKGAYQYTILHEKTRDRFLPYLDYVVKPEMGFALHDSSVFHARLKSKTFTYQGYSVPTSTFVKNSFSFPQNELITDSQPRGKSLALLDQWRSQAQSDTELVKLAFNHFKNNNFRYSLASPKLGSRRFDSFMFETQVGYCEHYASAFTIMMRWLGIPSRVVVGYQGGALNEAGDFLEIKYSDAHAWSEVWINNQWMRVDPTAAISPERIELGFDAFYELLEQRGLIESSGIGGLADFLSPKGFENLLKNLNEQYKNLTYQWNKWVLNYDFDKQRELLQKIGLDDEEKDNTYRTLIILMLLVFAIFSGWYFWQLRPKPIGETEAQRTYRQFVQNFKRFKIEKHIAETPLQFADRIRVAFPHLVNQINDITAQYISIRYSAKPVPLNRFKKSVKQFRVTKN